MVPPVRDPIHSPVRPIDGESALAVMIAAIEGEGPLAEERTKPEPNEGNYVSLRDLAFVLLKVIESGKFNLCDEVTGMNFDGLNALHRSDDFRTVLFRYLGEGTLILHHGEDVKIFDIAPDLLLGCKHQSEKRRGYDIQLRSFAKDCMEQYDIKRYSKASLIMQGAHEFLDLGNSAQRKYFDQVWEKEIVSFLYGGPQEFTRRPHPPQP